MASGIRSRLFRRLAAAVALAAVGLAGGCASTDDTSGLSVAPGRRGGPVDTGTYPNLNIAPRVATEQFTQQERDAKLAALDTARERQAPGSSGESTEARKRRLKLLADEHEANTLRVIESDQQ